jgi:hypothetical protein
MELRMKSRAITLGASVIALTIAGAGQAQAGGPGGLPEVGPKLPDTSVAAKAQANVQVPVAALVKGSLEAGVHGSVRPQTTVEVKQRSGGDQSHLAAGLDSRNGVTAYAGQHRTGRLELVAKGQAGPRYAESAVTGFARHGGKARVHAQATVKHERIVRSVRKQSRPAPTTEFPGSLGGHTKRLTPLQAIGREVANPIRPLLAGWLVVLMATGGFAAGRLVRRVQRTS